MVLGTRTHRSMIIALLYLSTMVCVPHNYQISRYQYIALEVYDILYIPNLELSKTAVWRKQRRRRGRRDGTWFVTFETEPTDAAGSVIFFNMDVGHCCCCIARGTCIGGLFVTYSLLGLDTRRGYYYVRLSG